MSPDPSLTLPPSEEVGAGGTVAIGGITYDDSFAASNPGAMYLSMTATGSLTAHDSKGAIVSGSGSNTITLGVGYADVTGVLGSLGYTAARAPDTIRFDLWDQAGIETTGSNSGDRHQRQRHRDLDRRCEQRLEYTGQLVRRGSTRQRRHRGCSGRYAQRGNPVGRDDHW